MDLELNGKRVLITGSYRGTGAGLARVLAREGALVHVHGFEIDPTEAVDCLGGRFRRFGFASDACSGSSTA